MLFCFWKKQPDQEPLETKRNAILVGLPQPMGGRLDPHSGFLVEDVGAGLSRNQTLMTAMTDEFRNRNRRTDIRVSALGLDSCADGAAFIAREHTFRTLASNHYRTAIVQPALWPEDG